MSCYSPLMMYDTGMINPETGKHVFEFCGKALTLNDPANKSLDEFVMVPCNRCIGCRLDYARQWANRMVLELLDNPDALFITLTYDEEHVPFSDKGYRTVSVRDCQLFMKSLRKHFAGKKIRFFLASEYGPKTKRPHYHGIFYGLRMEDFPDLQLYKYNNLHQPLYISELLSKTLWKRGFCTIGSVSRDTCAYTARYVLKKLKGKDTSFYTERGITPEFTLSSRRPGIGLGYFDNHKDYTDKISVFDGTETVSFPMPKKLFDKLIDVDPDLYYILKEARRASASSSAWLEWQQSDLEYLEFLDMKETEMYKKIKGISGDTRLDI